MNSDFVLQGLSEGSIDDIKKCATGLIVCSPVYHSCDSILDLVISCNFEMCSAINLLISEISKIRETRSTTLDQLSRRRAVVITKKDSKN